MQVLGNYSNFVSFTQASLSLLSSWDCEFILVLEINMIRFEWHSLDWEMLKVIIITKNSIFHMH